MSRLAVPIVTSFALLLSACAAGTPYQPLAPNAAARGGYAEQPVEPDRVRVTFAGNTLTSREDVELGMLYRAAELTLAQGFDWFEFSERRTDVKQTANWTSWPGPFAASGVHGRWSHGGARHHGFAAWHGGLHGPSAFDVRWETRDAFTAVGEIVMRHGEKPADNVRAFEARAVLTNIGPRLRRPEPAR